MKHLIHLLFFLTSLHCLAQKNIVNEIDSVFIQYSSAKNINNAVLQVYSTSKNIDISVSKNNTSTNLIDASCQPFYTASITKMFTATSIGILKDQKKLNFQDRIAQYLPDTLIKHLHVLDDKDYSKDITIAQLLQHTSGLPDYFTDGTIGGSPNIINQLLVDTNKIWLPQEMIEFTKEKMKPHFNPGQGYHYTDTEYVLLALIIEKVSGHSLDKFFQQYIFEPLGMDGSYINLKSKPLKNQLPVAEFYVGDMELSSIKSLSADWGGGGLVSTTKDLITFLEAFNADKIIKNNTRLAMQSWVYETENMQYGFGIRQVTIKDIKDEGKLLMLIGHTGSTASFLWYCPQIDTYIAGTLNQLEASKSALIMVYEILKIIENEN